MEEVSDLQAERPTQSGLTLEVGLIFTTFITLITGVFLGQWALAKYFDSGLFG